VNEHEQTNERTNERINERTNEWSNERNLANMKSDNFTRVKATTKYSHWHWYGRKEYKYSRDKRYRTDVPHH